MLKKNGSTCLPRLKSVNHTKCSLLYKKNPNLSLPKHVFFFNYCCCGENCFQYFVNVYWAMLKGRAQYISMGWNPSILDLVTIFVRKFGDFESTYFTPRLFYMIGICKHERVASAGDTDLDVIIAETNWSCKRVASTNPKLLALTSSNLIVPCGSHFIWRTPKSRVEPTWGFTKVQLRKVGTRKALPASNSRKE